MLTPQETEKLFRVLRKMRDDGKAIIIITHKMHEVESLSDRVAVLRAGKYIGSMMTKDTNVTEMTNMMVGHAVTLNIERPDPVDPKPRIEVQGLTVRSEDGILKLQDVSFTANSGEIAVSQAFPAAARRNAGGSLPVCSPRKRARSVTWRMNAQGKSSSERIR